ncbi:MAG: type II toxin-antitoxin system RelE/ParE family toxin [Bacteroidota bacterium]
MVEIRWTPQAIEDINSIAEYIAKDSFRYAKIQTERFFDTTEILITKPGIGRIVPEIKKTNIRELILGNYRIIYKIISTKRIDILTIHHSARRIVKSKLK